MIILKAENISKQYRLGLVGTGTISHDLNRWWAGVRGKEDPFLKIGSVNDRSTKADSDYVWALRDINFEVKRGEVLGIIGKNGAGKSTLLKILSRVTGPTTGEIKTKGRIASLLEVGTGFHPELTGRENIYLNGAILGMSKAEIKAKEEEIVQFSGCERYIDTPVKRYSSGMRVRLAFAVAAFLEPDILVIDEVLAVGDAEFQKKAVGKMQDISKGEGRTVLFVSHNMAAVKSLCTRAIVLENGKTVFEGGTDESVDYYIAKNSDKIIKMNYSSLDENSLFQEISIKNNIVSSGKTLRIDFKIHPKINEDKINIHIGVYDFNDEKVLHISSEYFNDGYIDSKNKNPICEIYKNPLIQGFYYINVGIVVDNTVAEELKKCLIFEVMNGDFFNTGIILKPSTLKAKALAHYKWC
ncbi:polysaccharide ABC transporter ATP-binding protein [Gelidibacter japonicus]|uniref:ABC transporter ATP-binding protein n=1 Tax=Gelidibacter japonicus TaxID=1962232 RepID=UPI003A8F2176